MSGRLDPVQPDGGAFLTFNPFQGGTDRAGPVSNKNQSKTWLLFKRDVVNPPGSHVSARHFLLRDLRACMILILISFVSSG